MSSFVKVMGGFLLGAAVGVTAGILLAPARGSKTRQRLAEGSRRLAGKLADTMHDSLDSFRTDYKRDGEPTGRSRSAIGHARETMTL